MLKRIFYIVLSFFIFRYLRNLFRSSDKKAKPSQSQSNSLDQPKIKNLPAEDVEFEEIKNKTNEQ
ncbi:MAG: hypothetical protein C4K58_06225 [Flavobacteriaceae bacterium]|nr:MAG: hypothetical protein C4K58_06225 [Flavobacteriaceae bacterium]